MVKYIGLIFIMSLCSTSLAFAQTTNPQIGGPIVPNIPSTQSTYCSNGICTTGITYNNGTITGNDTANLESRTHYPIIMIIPSELCTKAYENHIKTDCPPLQDIIKYDNSNQNISGKIVFSFSNGTTTAIDRTLPQVKNHWQYYANSNHTIICVYCTGNYLTNDLYQTIILESSDFSYAPLSFVGKTVTMYEPNATGYMLPAYNYTDNEMYSSLTTFSDRFVTDDCKSATIKYSDWLLNDTINYLKSGCKITSYNKTSTQTVPNTPWVYDNPFSSLHYLSALKQMTNGIGMYGTNGTVGGHGPGNCINGCSFTTSTKKPGW